MKCNYCNQEIPDNSLFCTKCGKKLEQPETKQIQFCTNCGSQLKAGALFCTNCGAKVGTQAKAPAPKTVVPDMSVEEMEKPVGKESETPKPQIAKTVMPKQEAARQQTIPAQQQKIQEEPMESESKGKGLLILCIVLAVLAVALMGVGFKFLIYDNYIAQPNAQVESAEDEDSDEDEDEKSEEDSDEPKSEEDAEKKDKTEEEKEIKVDYDLDKSNELEFSGNIRTTTDGNQMLKWTTPGSFGGTNSSGEKITQEEVSGAYIDDSALPDGMIQSVNAGEVVSVKGKFYFEGDKLYVTVEAIKNAQGADLVEQYQHKDEYVLPDSSTVLLTEADISGLSLQELNYAKNEIYARHGRMFDSRELQEYFGSKSWYNGTIAAANFSDNLLSEIERKNVKLLRDKEFSINPNGYQLDQ